MPDDGRVYSTDQAGRITRQAWYFGSSARQLRLVSGLVLFAYVTTHLIDHALLNASIGAADLMLLAQKFVWQSLPGSVLLYAALLTHAWLGVLALYTRRQFEWRAAEALQLLLGLCVPALLANHIAVTRVALTLYGLNKGYIAELASLYVAAPALGWLQLAVLVAAWAHACLGLGMLLRLRAWFPRWAPLLLAGAVLLPALALLGFVQGGRELVRALAEPGYRAAHLGPMVTGTPAQAASLVALRDDFLVGYGGLLLLVLVARGVRRLRELRAGLITITYADGGQVRVTQGFSVLEASRAGRIAHASVCGGRGRCSTCRVHVLASDAPLPDPAMAELRLLAAIGAPAGQVRLACQLRPVADLHVATLIPPAFALDYVAGRTGRIPEEERFITAMFVDLRGSTALAAGRAPFDSVFLVGRFIAAVSSAISANGGRPVQFLGDGVLAVFGLRAEPAEACRQALNAVTAIDLEMAPVRNLFMQETGHGLRYGVGLAGNRR